MPSVPSGFTRSGRRVHSGGRPPPSRGQTLPDQDDINSTSRLNLDAPLAQGSSSSSLDRLLSELELEITASPQASPPIGQGQQLGLQSYGGLEEITHAPIRSETTPVQWAPASSSAAVVQSATTGKTRSQTTAGTPRSRKAKPKMSLLTTNLAVPDEKTKQPVSPGAKHWTHVRAQVLGDHPTPVASTSKMPPAPPLKKKGLVSKAAGRLGFRQVAEQVLGYGPELAQLPGQSSPQHMTAAQEEEARERRRFSRDLKACLDSCVKEDTRRRLNNLKRHRPTQETTSKRQSSLPLRSSDKHAQYGSSHELPAFAPLLTALHAYVPAARAQKPWALTLPWHAEVLNELGTTFEEVTGDSGGQLMAVEIFGVLVRTWASARPEEELDRWVWICRALEADNKPLRARGMQLLAELLDPQTTTRTHWPTSPLALESFIFSLLRLAHAARQSQDLSVRVWEYIDAIKAGSLVNLSKREVCETYSHEPAGGDTTAFVEREIVWTAVLKAFKSADTPLLSWLAGAQLTGLDRFEPPPILHAMPPLVIAIRRQAAVSHLHALLRLSRTGIVSADTAIQRLETSSIPEIKHLEDLLEDASDLRSSCVTVLLQLLACSIDHRLGSSKNPFAGDTDLGPLSTLIGNAGWLATAAESIVGLVVSEPYNYLLPLLYCMLSSNSPEIRGLASKAMPLLWTRLTLASPSDNVRITSFLQDLQSNHPQILYRPFFTCAAAFTVQVVQDHLTVIRAMESALGSQLWTHASPDMLALVCMGDVQPGETCKPRVAVEDKLGKDAIFVELITAIRQAVLLDKTPVAQGSPLRGFLATLQHRFSLLLKAQHALYEVPAMRKGLMAQLTLIVAESLQPAKPPAWLDIAVEWATASTAFPHLLPNAATIRSDQQRREVLKRLLEDRGHTAIVAQDHTLWRQVIIEEDLSNVCRQLIALFHASVSSQSMLQVAQSAWESWDPGRGVQQSSLHAFLVYLGFEYSSDRLLQVIQGDLQLDASRPLAESKLMTLFAIRHQILASPLVKQGVKRSTLRFTPVEQDFVSSDVGSATWVATATEQHQDLLKFGRVLPLEVRQRLLDLGWSEDVAVIEASDWERVPISLLAAQHLEIGASDSSKIATPLQTLLRNNSTANDGAHAARRRAVLPPGIIKLILAHSDNGVESQWLAFVNIVCRDDAASISRAMCHGIDADTERASCSLQRIAKNTLARFSVPPAVAYTTFNSILGLLKLRVRTADPTALSQYAAHMGTLAMLAPSVCNLSLREIRRNKVEHLLLPLEALPPSDHREVSQHLCEVRSAQHHLMQSLLAANPRECYVLKSATIKAFPTHAFSSINNDASASPAQVTSARSWLLLVHQMLVSLNRNYNDQTELRDYLESICLILEVLGKEDVLITAHCMRVLLLAATRFRRLFATGRMFRTILVSIFTVYDDALASWAVQDCIEYTMRGLLSVHMSTFVFELCSSVAPLVAVSQDSTRSSERLFALLSCLSRDTETSCGVTSGIKGLNDIHERDALVAMVNDRPELDVAEIRSAADERHARRLETLAAERYAASTFSLDDTVRLFTTTIAADPLSPRAESFLMVLARMAPLFGKDSSFASGLIAESIDAIAGIFAGLAPYRREGPRTAFERAGPDRDGSTAANAAQLGRLQTSLLDLYLACLGATPGWSMKTLVKVIDLAERLLETSPLDGARQLSSILRRSAECTFESGPVDTEEACRLLQVFSPVFERHVHLLDVQETLKSLSVGLRRPEIRRDGRISVLVATEVVKPILAHVARVVTPRSLHQDGLALLLLAMLASADATALAALNDYPGSLSIISTVIVPLAERLSLSCDDTDAEVVGSVRRQDRLAAKRQAWVTLLSYVLRAAGATSGGVGPTPSPSTKREEAALDALAIQVIKLALVNAEWAVASIPGLWPMIGDFIKASATDCKVLVDAQSVRSNDWAVWSFARTLIHFKSPLMLEMRSTIQLILASAQRQDSSSRPSSPRLAGGRRSTSPDVTAHRRRPHSSSSPSTLARLHSRQSVKARRVSRFAPRFPDTEPPRGVDQGAIVHLIAAPTNVLTALASHPGRDARPSGFGPSLTLRDSELRALTLLACKEVRAAFGYDATDRSCSAWTPDQATAAINEETRMLEREFDICFSRKANDLDDT